MKAKPKRNPFKAKPPLTTSCFTGRPEWPKTVTTLTGEVKVYSSRKEWSEDAKRRYAEA